MLTYYVTVNTVFNRVCVTEKLYLQMKLFQYLKLGLFLVVLLKTKKKLCHCGGLLKPKVRKGENTCTTVVVYTRDGTEEGDHQEYR